MKYSLHCISFEQMKPYKSPLEAILEAFRMAHERRKGDVNLTECLILEKPHVFSEGLGSKIYVVIIDLDQVSVGTSYYCNH